MKRKEGLIVEYKVCPQCGGIVEFRLQPTGLAGQRKWFAHCPRCGLECGGMPSLDAIVAFWKAL